MEEGDTKYQLYLAWALRNKRLTQDWGQDKNWPTADWPVLSNDSRNNCGTHLGSCSLLLSKVVNGT